MSSVNKAILVGNVGNDPETREVNGQSVTNFSLATNESWTDSHGQKQERTQWHRIAAWGKLGETCARHLRKGRKVYVEGRINYRSTERDGQTVRYTDIVAQSVQFLGGVANGSDRGTEGHARSDSRPGGYQGSGYGYGHTDDEDIPF